MTREEAIKILRETHDNSLFSVRTALEIIIPELRESEDERIRKALYKMAKVPRKEIYEAEGITKEQALAWLEKQKEQKEETLRDFIDNFPYSDEQKEQKPVDLHDKIEELCSKYPINKFSVSDEELSAYHQGVHLGATKIAEYLSEQKPVEWSEEDEKIIGFIFDLLNDLVWRKDWAMSKEECLERLKSLRPQPKRDGGDDYNKGYIKGRADTLEVERL